MRQRLALAGALLGDPQVLLLDEPSNGLDPDGIRWLRNHLTDFARNGGSVFVSSHLIGELAMFADDLVVVGGGKLLAAETVDAIAARQTATVVAETHPARRARRAHSPAPGVCVDTDGRPPRHPRAPPRPPSPSSPSSTASASSSSARPPPRSRTPSST